MESGVNLQGTCSKLQGALTNLHDTCSKLQGTLTNLHRTHSNLQGTHSNLQEVLTNLHVTHNTLQGTLINLHGTHSNLHRVLSNLQGALSNLKGSGSNLQGTQAKTHQGHTICIDEHGLGLVIHADVVEDTQDQMVVVLIVCNNTHITFTAESLPSFTYSFSCPLQYIGTHSELVGQLVKYLG